MFISIFVAANLLCYLEYGYVKKKVECVISFWPCDKRKFLNLVTKTFLLSRLLSFPYVYQHHLCSVHHNGGSPFSSPTATAPEGP